MNESSKYGIKIIVCILLFTFSSFIGLLSSTIWDNDIIGIICVFGVLIAFGYGIFSGSKFSNTLSVEVKEKMLQENDEYYNKMQNLSKR